jgi:hypothetical protein
MSQDVWISAVDALSSVKRAGGTEDDLLEWARVGRLRARAKSGVDSNDVSPPKLWLECVQTFPAEPLVVDGIMISPWPDIPTGFWAEKPTKAAWVAGTFSYKVQDFCDYHQELTYACFELFGVTFNAGDLGALLPEPEPEPVIELVRGVLPSNAKPNDRLYEAAAHRAAELVRLEGGSRQKAFQKALLHGPKIENVQEASPLRALRQAYDLMYDQYGNPLKKDQN